MSTPSLKAFSKVREAREALAAKALELFDMHMRVIRDALDTGELEIAADHLKWLSEHMPADEDGVTMIDISVDKPREVEHKSGPTIQIGFALGGVSQPKELPAHIEAEPIEDAKK